MTAFARAPGKAFLSGEYAIFHGGTALVAAVDRVAYARIHPPRFESPLLRAAQHIADRDCEPCAIDVDTRQFQSSDGRKLGLGSSAATVVAALELRYHAQGLELTPDELFVLARRAHGRVQPGGSGADLLASIHGGVIQVVYDRESGLEVSAVALPPIDLVFVWTGISAFTPELVQACKPHAAPLVPLARDLAGAFVASDVPSLLGLVRRYSEAMAALGETGGVAIVTPAHLAFAELAERVGGAAKPSGAGGGDLSFAVVGDPEAAQALRQLARGVGLEPLDLRVSPLGAKIIRSHELPDPAFL